MATKLAYKGNEITGGGGGIEGIVPIEQGGTGNEDGYIRTGAKEGTTVGTASTAEGYQVTVTGNYSHGGGYKNIVSGKGSFVTGGAATAYEDSGAYPLDLSSGENINNGDQTFVIGTGNNIQKGINNAVIGNRNSITGNGFIKDSMISGSSNTISDAVEKSIITGEQNVISGEVNHSVISGSKITNSNALGDNLITGRENKLYSAFQSVIAGNAHNNDDYIVNSFLGGYRSTCKKISDSVVVGKGNGTSSCDIISSFIGGADNAGFFVNSLVAGVRSAFIRNDRRLMNSVFVGDSNGDTDNASSNPIISSIIAGSRNIIDNTINGVILAGNQCQFENGSYMDQTSITGQYLHFNRDTYLRVSSIVGSSMYFSKTEGNACWYSHSVIGGNQNSFSSNIDSSIVMGKMVVNDSENIGSGSVSSIRVGSHLRGCGSSYAVFGRFNSWQSGDHYDTNPDVPTSNLLTIGKGEYQAGSPVLANAFRVAATAVYGAGAYNSTGADYAEMFEWEDGNLTNEDRRGRFVTLDGEKIRLAESESDFILGITSANPSVCADVYDDQYKGMYETDIFGAPVWEDIYHEETEVDEEVETYDKEGKPVKSYVKKTIPAWTQHTQKIREDFNPDETYIARSDRPEWQAVGMLGKLVMVDDGTATINGYVKPSAGGIATVSTTPTRYRVMSRLDDTHIKILVL